MYYKYNESIPQERKGGFGLSIFDYKNGFFNRIPNKKRKISSLDNIIFNYYSSHYINSSQSTNFFAKPIQKMLKEGKDTLHIGTVKDFKKKHKELFEKLTKGDSISIQFLDGKELGERVSVPVEW